MDDKRVKIFTCESGGWEILRYGELFESQKREISRWDWMMLLRQLGYEVEEVCVNDKEMERLSNEF